MRMWTASPFLGNTRLWRHTETHYSPAVMFLFKPKVTFLEPGDCSLFNWEAK